MTVQNRPDIRQRRSKIVIDHHMVEFGVMPHFRRRIPHSTRYDFGTVLATANQPLAERFTRGRKNKDGHRIRHELLDAPGTLPVNIKNHVLASEQEIFNRLPRGAVVVVKTRACSRKQAFLTIVANWSADTKK